MHSILDSLGWCDLDQGQGKRVFKKGQQHMQQHSQVGSLRGCRPKIRVQALSLKWLYCSNPSSFLQTQTFKQAGGCIYKLFFSTSSFLCGNIIINVCLRQQKFPTRTDRPYAKTPWETLAASPQPSTFKSGDKGRVSLTGGSVRLALTEDKTQTKESERMKDTTTTNSSRLHTPTHKLRWNKTRTP